MKKWVEKLIEQFDFDWNENGHGPSAGTGGPLINEERATLLFLLDTYNKHLIDIEGHPVRKVRDTLDEFARELLQPRDKGALEKTLFRFRQFFGAYRVAETGYYQKTLEDFREIVWGFVDQLSEEMAKERHEDFAVQQSLEELKEAVESNSINALKKQTQRFIETYMDKQSRKIKRRESKMKSIRKNLNTVKKQLGDAQHSLRTDHLTQAFNRKTFDEYALQYHRLFEIAQQPVTMMLIDIDYFKRINDSHGHPVGDFVLQELVKTLKSMFKRDSDLIARIGGEEFAILLPDFQAEHAMRKAEEILERVRAEVYVHENREIRFTVSIGVATLAEGETVSNWLKRADEALYHSKNTGRNRATLAPSTLKHAA